MLDTIVLTLNHGMFTILERDRFTPSASGLYDQKGGYHLGGRANMKCTQNPTATELKRGIYKPRLTVSKRPNREGGFDMPLKVEFSAPKLLYGNNFDELSDTDFTALSSKLLTTLKQMGVYVFEDNLKNAPVSSLHFSKNIPLNDYSTPYTYVKQLEKVNFNAILDTSKTDYFNGGSGIKAHANSYEIAFYDKIQDLRKAKTSPKRAYEADSQVQLELFDSLTKMKPFEVLRMEIRLGKKQKLKQILSKIGLDIVPTFQNMFKQDVAKKVLLYYLTIIEDAYPPILRYQFDDPVKFFNDFLIQNQNKRYSSAFKYVGVRAIMDLMGTNEFRNLLNKYNPSIWYALNKDMKKLKKLPETDTFNLLRDTVTNYQPLKLVDFQL